MLDTTYQKDIKRTIVKLFQTCGTPMTPVEFDEELYAAAYARILQHGYPLDDPDTMKAFSPYLKLSNIAATAVYPHVQFPYRSLICAIITLFLAVDDYFADKPEFSSGFNNHFIRGEPQEHPLLELFACLLRDIRKTWEATIADMMVQSAMAFVTSLAIEHRLQDVEIPQDSPQLGEFLRNMSGISGIFCLFMFPFHVTPEVYMTALPPMIAFMNYANDICSFYKEELDGEASNYISIRARSSNTNKLDELKETLVLSIDQYRHIEDIVQSFPKTCGMLPTCWSGYLRYHLTVPRYKLSELADAEHVDAREPSPQAWLAKGLRSWVQVVGLFAQSWLAVFNSARANTTFFVFQEKLQSG